MNWHASEEAPDEELLARFLSAPHSDEGRRAVQALLGGYRRRVYGECLRAVPRHDEALDLAQAVLLKAWRALPGFDPRSRFSSWLFTLTRDECVRGPRQASMRRDPAVEPARPLVDLMPPRAQALESKSSLSERLRAYREFMAPGESPDPNRQCEAEARLAESLASEIGIPIEVTSGSVALTPSAREAPPSRPARGPLFARLGPFSSRPAFVAAGALALAAGAVLFVTQRGGRDLSLLHETIAALSGQSWQSRAGARRTPNGGVVLHWTAEPRATRYVVVFLNGVLDEADRIDGIETTELVLTRDALPRGLTPGAQVMWRVVAYQGADEIGHSPTSSLKLP